MVGNAVEKIRELSRDQRPWLLVGKGPSLDRRAEFDLVDYHVLTLNHSCRVIRPTLAHFTDLEAAMECICDLDDQNAPMILPWHPHVGFRPSPNSIGDYVRNDSGRRGGLGRMYSRNLLYSYNSTRARNKVDWLPIVHVRFFSAVAGLNLLAMAGVREIRSIGVDGGTGYAKELDAKDCLANGRDSFDAQFTEMRKTVAKYKLNYQRLDGAAL